jgi:hypothetical protein
MDLRSAVDAIRPSTVQITVTATGLSEDAVQNLGGHGEVFSRPIGTGFLVGSDGTVVTLSTLLTAYQGGKISVALPGPNGS